jgi:ribosomal protein S18 acetylase RimI-like enzyme
MTRASTPIRQANGDDLPQVVDIIVAAFVADPPARFAWPTPHDYLGAMPRAVRDIARTCIQHGTACVSDDLRGAALWLPPGAQMDGDAIDALFRETAAPDRLGDLLATFEKMGEAHPQQPHWYLPQIGVDPAAQGTGLGSALMRHALARCDREPAWAYLEASKAENIPFYARHGFEAVGQIQVGAGPAITPMVRRPRRANARDDSSGSKEAP